MKVTNYLESIKSITKRYSETLIILTICFIILVIATVVKHDLPLVKALFVSANAFLSIFYFFSWSLAVCYGLIFIAEIIKRHQIKKRHIIFFAFCLTFSLIGIYLHWETVIRYIILGVGTLVGIIFASTYFFSRRNV